MRKMTESSIKLLEGEKAKEARKVRDMEKSEIGLGHHSVIHSYTRARRPEERERGGL